LGGYDGVSELWDNGINKVTHRFGRPPLNSPQQMEQYINAGMPDCIRDVSFSPDGNKMLITVLALTNPVDQGKVTMIDLSTGIEILELLNSEKVANAFFSPDGTRILTLSQEGMLKLWDSSSGRETFSLSGVTCAAFSPDSQRLAIGSEDRTVQMLDASQSASPSKISPTQTTKSSNPANVESKKTPVVTPKRDVAPKITQEQILTRSRLQEIYRALDSYSEEFKHLPRPAISDESGRPLLSWRVTLLPYLNQNDLFKKFKLDEAWDSEHNQKVLLENRCPKFTKSPGSRET
jgi:WD40 repeat protein